LASIKPIKAGVNQPRAQTMKSILSTWRSMRTVFAAVTSASVLLAGCGGGGGGGEPVPVINAKAEGVYEGSLSGSSSTYFQMLVLENDEYWALYGRPVGGQFGVAGFIQGQGTSSNGQFASSSARDFGLSPPLAGTVAANYSASNIGGTVATSAGAIGFSGVPIASTTYVYATPARPSDIAGVWSLGALDGSRVTLTIDASGAFTGSAGGCLLSGTIRPRATGKNVFNVALGFGASPCASPNSSGAGVAISYPLTASSRQLIVVGVNPSRTAGTALFGVR
jgi:hypothetical protein